MITLLYTDEDGHKQSFNIHGDYIAEVVSHGDSSYYVTVMAENVNEAINIWGQFNADIYDVEEIDGPLKKTVIDAQLEEVSGILLRDYIMVNNIGENPTIDLDPFIGELNDFLPTLVNINCKLFSR